MASNHTTNYQLNQWSAEDRVLRTEFNADNEKTDAALAALAAQTAAKASQEEVNGLKNVVAVKADKSAVDTLAATVNTKASQSDLNALRSNIAAGDLWVKVLKHTTAAAGTSFSIDLSGIDFTKYWQVKLLFRGAANRTVSVTLNGDTSNVYKSNDFISGNSTGAALAYLPCTSATPPVMGELTSQVIMAGDRPAFFLRSGALGQGASHVYTYYPGCTWETLQSMQFTVPSAGNIPAGAEVLILGLVA